MALFRFSRLAEADLINVSAYTLRTWGEEQAIKYLDELEACCERLTLEPEWGSSCNEIRPGLRRINQGKHVVFFRRDPGGILISRILHERMLPGAHSID